MQSVKQNNCTLHIKIWEFCSLLYFTKPYTTATTLYTNTPDTSNNPTTTPTKPSTFTTVYNPIPF